MSNPDRNGAATLPDNASPDVPALPDNAPPAPPGYQLETRIGRGGMGEVYRARDTRTGRTVAIKFTRAGYEARFRREFRQLKRLDHPRIVAVYDYDANYSPPYFVMEFLTGRTLEAFRREFPDGRLPRSVLLPIFGQIAEALAHVHAQVGVHRDLKPDNVMVLDQEDDDGAGQVAIKLMDFGLIRPARPSRQLTETGALLGTWAYTSPEQFQAPRHVDRRSDLYSLGVMLYEAASGRRPFRGDSLGQLLKQHIYEPPQPPGELVADLSPELETLILRLLEKNPDDRYPAAEALLADLTAQSEEPLPKIEVRFDPYVTALFQPPLIGREAELDRLLEAFEQTQRGLPIMTAIGGEAGVGKTRLIEGLLERLAMHQARILRTRVDQRINPAFGPLLDMLHSAFEGLRQARDVLSPAFWPLAALLPELAETPELRETPRPPSLPPEQEQARLFETVARFLAYVAGEHPLVLFFDDLQWVDQDTLYLVPFLLNRLGRLNVPLLLCGTYRSEDVVRNPGLEALFQDLGRRRQLMRLELERLSAEGVRAMLSGMLGQALPALADALFAETEGNPFFVEEVIRDLVEGKVLKRVEGVWRWTGDRLSVPSTVMGVIEQRLSRLGDDSRGVLRLAALIGAEFHFDLLLEASKLSEDELLDTTEEWLRAELVRELEDDRFAFTHGKLQEVARSGVIGRRLARLHLGIAQAIEACYAGQLEEHAEALAHHYRQGRQPARALTYALQAAQHAREQYAFTHARQLIEQTLDDLTAETPFEKQVELYRSLGETSTLLGEHREAVLAHTRAYEILQSAPQAAPPDQLADLARRIGREHGWAGDIERALNWLETGRGLVDPERGRTERDALALIDIHTASILYQQGQFDRAGELCQRGLRLLGETGDPEARAEGYNLLGAARDARGQATAALAAYQTSIDLWTTLGNEYRVAQVENNLALAHFYLGDWTRAREIYVRVLGFFSEIGDRHRVAVTETNLGLVDYNLGNYEAAADHHLHSIELASELGIPWLDALARVNLAWVHVARARWDRAEVRARESVSIQTAHEISESLPEAYRVLAQVAAGRGQLDLARDEAERALQLAREQENRLEEGAAERVLGKALRLARDFPSAEAHLQRSLEILEGLGNRFEAARTRRQLARLNRDAGDEAMALSHAVRALTVFVTMGARGEAKSMEAGNALDFHLPQPGAGAAALCRSEMAAAGWVEPPPGDVHLPAAPGDDRATLHFNLDQHQARIKLHARPEGTTASLSME